MSWFMYVFGVVAMLNMVVVGAAVGLDLTESWRRRRARHTTISEYERKVEAYQQEVDRLRAQIVEVTKKNNAFGRICP